MHESAVPTAVFCGFSLLLFATVVHIFVRRLSVPYSVMLVVGGMGLNVLSRQLSGLAFVAEFQPSPELIFIILLPTLIFEASFNIEARALYKLLGPILMLATLGVLVSTFFIGVVLSAFLGQFLPLSFAHFLLFGALISATDPVAVSAIFREVGAPKRLETLVEGESIFNDATSIVLFKIVAKLAVAGGLSGGLAGAAAAGSGQFLVVFLGGLLVGAAVGLLCVYLVSFLEGDTSIEIGLSLIAAYLSFILSEHYLHLSGVMATLGAGLVLAGFGRPKFSAEALPQLTHFWETLAHLANSLIFLLIGLSLSPGLFVKFAVPLLITIPVCFLARGVTLYLIPPLIVRLRGPAISAPYRATLIWGGLRGAIALGLALTLEEQGLPPQTAELFRTLTLGVVLSTLLVQATTIRRVVELLGLSDLDDTDELALKQGRLFAEQAGRAELDGRREEGLLGAEVVERLGREVAGPGTRGRDLTADEQARSLMIECLSFEKRLFSELYYRGELSETLMKDLTHLVEVQHDRVLWGKDIKQMTIATVEPYRILIARGLERLSAFDWAAPLVARWRRQEKMRDYEEERARVYCCRRVLSLIEQLKEEQDLLPKAVEIVEETWRTWLKVSRDRMEKICEEDPELVRDMDLLIGWRLKLTTQSRRIKELYEEGLLTHKAFRRLEREYRERLLKLRKRLFDCVSEAGRGRA